MKKEYIIRNVNLVNEQQIFCASVHIRDGLIQQISKDAITQPRAEYINGEGLYLFPGLIDDQVHFREPGLTHKGDIYTESRAAVAGGITSFMEMPNTVPPALTQELLQQKYDIAATKSAANYSFYMGVSNNNTSEVLKTDPEHVCGIKVFLGSSTGNLLVNDYQTLEKVFREAPTIIAAHCEDEATIRRNMEDFATRYGHHLHARHHPQIRSHEACYLSSSFAVNLARQCQTRLHIFHLSTAKEISLLRNDIPLKDKKITAEVCLHHLWFCDEDYERLHNLIKWNPSVKSAADRDALLKALKEGYIDVLATDHAPHTLEEKQQDYLKAPSGGPLVQHALPALIEMFHQGKISLQLIAEKYAHNVAELFRLQNRGYLREGYAADLVLVDLHAPWKVEKKNLLYKCGWSPFEGVTFRSAVVSTFVNGYRVYHDGRLFEEEPGKRLIFHKI